MRCHWLIGLGSPFLTNQLSRSIPTKRRATNNEMSCSQQDELQSTLHPMHPMTLKKGKERRDTSGCWMAPSGTIWQGQAPIARDKSSLALLLSTVYRMDISE